MTPEQLKQYNDAFIAEVRKGDLLFHGDTATAKAMGVTLSTTGMACAMCHPMAADTHPGSFPKFQSTVGQLTALRDMINWCIEKPYQGEQIDTDSEAMKALEAYIYWSNTGSILDTGKYEVDRHSGVTAAMVAPLRRSVLRVLAWGGLTLAGGEGFARQSLAASNDTDAAEDALVSRLLVVTPVESSLFHILMPFVFSNGYSVPMSVNVDSPMTESNYVKAGHILAPQNPIIPVGTFAFTPASRRAAVSTRIRLARPQHVIAIAEISDNTLLTARTWVKVDTDGCG